MVIFLYNIHIMNAILKHPTHVR